MMPALGGRKHGQEAGVVLALVGTELVMGLHPVPDRVLLGAGQYRYGLGELAVGRQRPVRRMFASTTASRWSDLPPDTE